MKWPKSRISHCIPHFYSTSSLKWTRVCRARPHWPARQPVTHSRTLRPNLRWASRWRCCATPSRATPPRASSPHLTIVWWRYPDGIWASSCASTTRCIGDFSHFWREFFYIFFFYLFSLFFILTVSDFFNCFFWLNAKFLSDFFAKFHF